MTPVQILFILVAAASLGSALMVVTTRNLVHAALWLIATLFGIAVFYVLLRAGFLAVVQVVVYIGAISILMIFAIMLTRRVASETGPQTTQNWGWSAVISLVLFAGLVWILANWPGFYMEPVEVVFELDPLRQLGTALVSPEAYLLPFELASVLLLGALIGSIVIAWEQR